MITKDATQTALVGEQFAKDGERIICLYGDLGSGKTTFTQGFARGLGIGDRLLSPTFIIVRRYRTGDAKFFYHMDLYRVQKEEDLDELGLSEIFADPGAYVVVEWAEKLGSFLPPQRTDITFRVLDDGRHELWIRKH